MTIKAYYNFNYIDRNILCIYTKRPQKSINPVKFELYLIIMWELGVGKLYRFIRYGPPTPPRAPDVTIFTMEMHTEC